MQFVKRCSLEELGMSWQRAAAREMLLFLYKQGKPIIRILTVFWLLKVNIWA